MDKYKVVRIFNLLFAIAQLFFAFSLSFVVLPRLLELYTEFGNDMHPNSRPVYIQSLFLLIMALANLYLFYKMLNSDLKVKEKYYKFALTLVIISFILSAPIVGGLVTLIILPIYNLTSQF